MRDPFGPPSRPLLGSGLDRRAVDPGRRDQPGMALLRLCQLVDLSAGRDAAYLVG